MISIDAIGISVPHIISTYDFSFTRSQQERTEVVTSTTENGETRRLVFDSEEIECRLWDNCMLFQDGRSTHEWMCSFDDPNLSQTFSGFEDKVIVGSKGEDIEEYMKANSVESGKIVMIFSEAEVMDDRVIIDFDKILGLEDYDSSPADSAIDARRNLAPTTGTLNTLVVRVNGLDNSAPAAEALSSDIFFDDYCLKTQSARCSFNKMRIEEYIPGNGISNVPTVAPGVVEVNVNINSSGASRGDFQSRANTELRTIFGTNNVGSLFHLVLFCMPPGMGNWLAYAYIGRWDSYYNNDWCQSLSAQMYVEY